MSVFITNPKTGKSTAAFQIQIETNIRQAEELLRGIPGGAETALNKAILKARRSHSKFAEEEILNRYTMPKGTLRKKDSGMTRARITPSHKKTGAAGYGNLYEIKYTGFRIPLSELVESAPEDHRINDPILSIYRSTWRLDGNGAKAKHHEARVYGFKESVLPQSVRIVKDRAGKDLTRSFVAKVKAGESSTHTGFFEREEGAAQRGRYPNKNGYMVSAINGDQKLHQKMGPSVEEMLSREDIRNAIDAKMNRKIGEEMNSKIRSILEGKISV